MKKGSNRAKTAMIHEMELRKHRLKVADQHKELVELSKENARLYETVRNLMKIHNAIIAATAMKFGTQTGEKTVELTIPLVDVEKITSSCDISVARNEKKETIIRITKKRKKERP